MRTQIIYEDNDILVCHKPAGFPVQTRRAGSMDMESELLNYLHRKGGSKTPPYVGIIHRLDQPVEGLLVFAKTPFVAAKLNQQMQKEGFGKYYIAEISGKTDQEKGTLTDYLIKNGKASKAEIVRVGHKDAKKAILYYEQIREEERTSFLKIQLETGRFHQIRVQLSARGCPIIGDTKYNPDCQAENTYQTIHLCAWRLAFRHPKTGEKMEFEICPEWYSEREDSNR